MDRSDPIRILLIDDDQGDFQMTRAMVGQIEGAPISLDWVPSYQEGLDAFRADEHDVYLVDYFLEDRDGLKLVRQARELGIRKPMIMLTGRGSHDVDVEAMKAGAPDYLVKGRVDADQLERTIRYALQRQRAEEALRDSEERHRGMCDHLPIGLYRVSPEGRFMDANPALVRILGYPDSKTIQDTYSADLYVNPQDRRRFREMLDRYGVARGFETRLQRSDGSTTLVRNTARAHRGTDGRILYIEGAVEDVAETDRANVLREGAEHFRTISEASKLAILLVDLQGARDRGQSRLPARLRLRGCGPARAAAGGAGSAGGASAGRRGAAHADRPRRRAHRGGAPLPLRGRRGAVGALPVHSGDGRGGRARPHHGAARGPRRGDGGGGVVLSGPARRSDEDLSRPKFQARPRPLRRV